MDGVGRARQFAIERQRRTNERVKGLYQLEQAILDGTVTPTAAAQAIGDVARFMEDLADSQTALVLAVEQELQRHLDEVAALNVIHRLNSTPPDGSR